MIKKLFGYSMATWIGALISFVLLPIASHLYTSYELGIINYYYSIINIIFTFILLGLDQAYLRFYTEYSKLQKRQQFARNIVYTIAFILLLSVLSLFFSSRISQWLIGQDMPIIIVIILCHLIGLVITRYFVILFRLESKLVEYTFFSVINTILLKCVYLVGYPFEASAVTGIWATAIISIVIAILLVINKRAAFSFVQIMKYDNLFSAELKYALPLVPAMVLAILNNSIPQIILRSKTDFSNVAIYSIGVTLASTITLLHNGLNTFLEPYIFKNHETNKEQIARILNIFTVGAYLICMFVILFQDVFFMIFKKEYSVSTQFLPLLFCSSLWYTIGDFYNVGVKISKKTKDNIPIYTLGFIANAMLSYLLIPSMGCIGAALSASIASAIMAILKMVRGNKYYKIIDNYRNIYLGAILLITIATCNYVFWTSQIKYYVVVACILIYTVGSGILLNVSTLFKK